MKLLLGVIAVILLTLIAVMLGLGSSPEPKEPAGVSNSGTPGATSAREPAELTNPERLDAAETDIDRREDQAVDLSPQDVTWRLIVNLRGVQLEPLSPIRLSLVALGADDEARVELTLKPNSTRQEFDITSAFRKQPFERPTIEVQVDHEDYFVWDELLEAQAGANAARAFLFEADIVLEPMTASLAGRVHLPAGHPNPARITIFPIEETSGYPERDFLIDRDCNEDGSFAFRLADVANCLVVAHSEGLQPDTLALRAQPGTTHENISMVLDNGLSIEGQATLDGAAITENCRLVAEANVARPGRMAQWFCGNGVLHYDGQTRSFYSLRITAQPNRGSELRVNGLQDREYNLLLYRGSGLSRLGTPPLRFGPVRPGTGLNVQFESEPDSE